jgi:hypothetical protein
MVVCEKYFCYVDEFFNEYVINKQEGTGRVGRPE